MKDMTNFKGTKGEFTESPFRKGLIGVFPDNPIDHVTVCKVYGANEESEADTRLFANSKKVLEAAIETIKHFESLEYWMKHYNNLHMRTIKQTWDAHKEKISKLEQAINDSL